ncbi:hypothetical protein KKA95_02210 [Patescibacteria group bacterium]|nr:hypothetical protein [Patescibacteria group bacterium]
MLNKKAIAMEKLIIWSILLVSFVLISFTVSRLVAKAEPMEAEIICRDSLLLKANTQIQIVNVEVASTPALCKTVDKKFAAAEKDEALQFIANSIERCWWIWLEGKYDQILGPRGIGGDDEAPKCFVCNTLVYQQGPTVTKTEIIDYLGRKNSRYVDASIIDYIQQRGYVDFYENTFSAEEVYAVVYASNIDEGFWSATFGRQLGFYPPYNQNGLWMLKLNRFDAAQPCLYQPDVAGE